MTSWLRSLRRRLFPKRGMEALAELVAELKPAYEAASQPSQLRADPRFVKGALVLARDLNRGQLAGLLTSDNPITSLLAAEALVHGNLDAAVVKILVPTLAMGWWWTRREILRHLGERVAEPLTGWVLATLVPERGWEKEEFLREGLREFIRARANRETPTFGDRLANASVEHLAFVATLLEQLGPDAPPPLVDEIRLLSSQRVDVELLKTVGRVRGAGETMAAEVVPFPPMQESANAILEVVCGAEPRSVLLMGENGVGKSSVLQLLGARLAAEGWLVFEAGAAELIAGQSYIGQLEGRLQALIRALEGRRVVWIVPGFGDLAWAGRHRYQPIGALDVMMPAVEQGSLRIVGEISPAAHQRLLTEAPRVRTAFQVMRMPALGEPETHELVHLWSQAHTAEGAPPRVPDQVVREAALLARQYFPDRAAPGNVLHLLQVTHRALLAAGIAREPLTTDDILGTLSHLTGLPMAMLDDREVLPIDHLRMLFARRVLGQKEPVEALVERVAMIKAGLTDPTRPLGVFLFVGPTGTGKTEIAKALAEFLFGSAERLLRLDMSEFQSPDSVARIVGTPEEFGPTTSLADGIRKQPFSVVLLDEFEKADPSVWDLFLQVFDDGRLTDRRGHVADFRHAIIIMTSNLGARMAHGASLGFAPDGGGFTSAAVGRSVAGTFRPEFVNRLDRVIVFQPLSRTVMRELVRKELSELRERRGLRNRQWAIEWDDGVIDFLLEKGFSAELGARPLKRAIERYLLAPLATTIVRHEVPAGDQFLFVRRDGEALNVQFVDPDAPEEIAAAEEAPAPGASLAEPPRLEALVVEARGTPEEFELLGARLSSLESRQADSAWTGHKEAASARMAEPDFWTATDRFAVLGRIEYLDRIKAGLETARSLRNRLAGFDHRSRARYPGDVVSRLALQIHLLEAACAGVETGEPWDAFVLVRAGDTATASAHPAEADGSAYARSIAQMYARWATRRRMQLRIIEETPVGAANPYRWIAAVSGYAAYRFLLPESGWHVIEFAENGSHVKRARVEVRVEPQPWEPLRTDEDWRREALRALEGPRRDPAAIVRRYRWEPSPLVRDAVRGWRTGRLDRVLNGDFDVIS